VNPPTMWRNNGHAKTLPSTENYDTMAPGTTSTLKPEALFGDL
jgi:hypothetical protein